MDLAVECECGGLKNSASAFCPLQLFKGFMEPQVAQIDLVKEKNSTLAPSACSQAGSGDATFGKCASVSVSLKQRLACTPGLDACCGNDAECQYETCAGKRAKLSGYKKERRSIQKARMNRRIQNIDLAKMERII